MPITYIADGGYNNATNFVSGCAFTKPTGVISGDLLLAFIAVTDSNHLSTLNTLAGWTKAYGPQLANATGSGSWNQLYAFYKVAGGSEPASYTWTATLGSGSTAHQIDGEIRAYRGVAASGAIVNHAIGASTNTTTMTIPTFVGVELYINGEWYVAGVADLFNNPWNTTTPTLSHVFFNAGSANSFSIGDYAPASAPVAEVITSPGYGGQTVAIGITLAPATVDLAGNFAV